MSGGVASVPVDLLTGLRAYYRLDNLDDSSGNGHDLDFGPEGAGFGPGKIGSALHTGSAEQTNDLLTGGVLAGAYTIAFWVRFGGVLDGVVQIQALSAGAAAIELNIQIGATDVSIEWLDGSVTIASSETFAADTWHHVVLVVDGGMATFYIDAATDETVSSADATAFDPAGTFSLSVVPATGGAVMDEVAIYSIALSLSQVLALWNDGAGFDPTA